MKILVPSFRALMPALFAFTLLAGCGKEETKAPAPRPPVDVTVMAVTARDTPVTFEFVGQTQSSREVEIRARVDGFLEKRLYVEGDLVRAGQPLFQIDRKPLAAWLAAQDRYTIQEVAKLMSSPPNELGRVDRLRLSLWIAPLIMPFYCLLARRLILDGRRGLVYSLERTYAEVLLALRLYAARRASSLARNEQSPTPSG